MKDEILDSDSLYVAELIANCRLDIYRDERKSWRQVLMAVADEIEKCELEYIKRADRYFLLKRYDEHDMRNCFYAARSKIDPNESKLNYNFFEEYLKTL